MNRIVQVLILIFGGLQLIVGFDLKCGWDSVTTGFISGKRCFISQISAQFPSNQMITSLDGQPETFYHSEDRIMFDINLRGSLSVYYWPQGLGNLMPQLEAFALDTLKLRSIKKRDVEVFKKLKMIWCRFNDLESLDSDLFEPNPDLMYANFDGNKLKFIGENIFEPTPFLQEAFFHNNNCIDSEGKSESAVQVLRTELREKCPHYRERYCSKEINDLKLSMQVLEAKNKELSLQNAKLQTVGTSLLLALNQITAIVLQGNSSIADH